MWQPANKAALPSPEDFKHAEKAINDLEDVLKDALAVLEQAQSRVRALTKELDERKAWLAPIRKLPSELLSEIFIFGSEMGHLAPVTITEVSRLWRAVVLATPRAWSLIYGDAIEHEYYLDQYISTFVERSNPCLLHIRIRDLDYDTDSDDSEFEPRGNRVLSLLWASLSRIRCLSIGSWQLRRLSEECMPNLSRLMINNWADSIHPFFVNRERFPHLQYIHSRGCSWEDSQSLTSFPPLQELAVQINHYSTWLDVVKNCSATLKALTLAGHLEWTERVTIIFPCLQSLTLIESSGSSEPAEWSITMVTPGLISYSEFSPASTASKLRHGDVRSVALLRSYYIPDLVPHTGLRVLQISTLYSPAGYLARASELAEQLKQDINASPALELVEFRLSVLSGPGPELESAKRDVTEKIKSARPGIKLSFTQEFSPMPGSMEEKLCKPCMPCSSSPV